MQKFKKTFGVALAVSFLGLVMAIWLVLSIKEFKMAKGAFQGLLTCYISLLVLIFIYNIIAKIIIKPSIFIDNGYVKNVNKKKTQEMLIDNIDKIIIDFGYISKAMPQPTRLTLCCKRKKLIIDHPPFTLIREIKKRCPKATKEYANRYILVLHIVLGVAIGVLFRIWG